MDLFYYVNMIICCFFSGCMCSWRFVYSTSHIEVIHHWLLVGGIQVGSVEVITVCYIFRDSVVCLWWIYEMCSICNSCRWFHRLCLRELFFHGLGSRLGVPFSVYQDFSVCYVCLFYYVHKVYWFCYWFTESALLPSFCTLLAWNNF